MGRQKSGGETTLLFVYGTLRRNFAHPMGRLLARQARYLGSAHVAGRLYRVGHYPAFTPSRQAGEWVVGDLYDLAGSPGLLARLDRYEGLSALVALAEYRREVLPAQLADGSYRLAWVYLYNRPVSRLPRLVSGDFLRQRRRPPQR